MISVVIPTYSRSETTLRLLGDVERQVGVEFEVIVVDDCSPVNPVVSLTRQFPRVTLLRNNVNSGPAVTRNRGIRAARGEIIVGFDNDVSVPDRTTLAKVAAIFAERPDVDGLAFRLLQPDGATEDAARWWHPVPIDRYAHRQFSTSYFSGTAYAFRREAMLAAGLFPEILFMHYEEVELAYRILDRGGTILYHPELSVLHHAHPVSRRSEIKVFYKPRNQVLLAVGCLPLVRAIAYVAPRLAFHFLVAVRNGHLPAFFRALRSAGEKLPDRWKQRRVLQRATFRRLAALRAD